MILPILYTTALSIFAALSLPELDDAVKEDIRTYHQLRNWVCKTVKIRLFIFRYYFNKHCSSSLSHAFTVVTATDLANLHL